MSARRIKGIAPGVAVVIGLALNLWIASALMGHAPAASNTLAMAAAGVTIGASFALGWLALNLIASSLMEMAERLLRRVISPKSAR